MSGPAIRTVLAVCLIAVVFLGAHAAKLRSAGYNYAVTADANYDFSRTRVRSLDAELRGGQVMIPARPPTADGVLMSVRLRSTLLGRWFDPSVQIDAGAETFTQTFERGGSGLRYLNLSNFPLGSMTPIRLRGHFVEISDQTVQIRYLASDVDAAHQTLLVLSPHPDDAEIAAFGLYAHHDAYVVTLTAGEAGEAGTFARFPGRAAFLEKGRTRAWNSRAVPMLGGLSPDHTANLGYFDGTLAAMHAHPEVAVTSLESAADTLAEFRQGRAPQLIPERPDGRATWVNLVRDLEYIVEHVKPDLIVTPYPLLDAHPDHQLTTIALIEALRDLGWNQGILLLYTNHSPGSSRYPYGESGELVGLPPTDSAPVFDGLVSNPLNQDEQGRKYLALDAMIDIRAETGPASLLGSARFLTTALRKKLYGDDESYYRRAVRANEMFLELRVSSLSQPGVLERLEGPLAPRPTTP